MEECCYIDIGDPPSVYMPRTVRARKMHVCCECNDPIQRGEQYEIVTGCWDGRWSTFKTCGFCLKVRRDFFPHGHLHGEQVESFHGCYGWDYRYLPNDEDQ